MRTCRHPLAAPLAWLLALLIAVTPATAKSASREKFSDTLNQQSEIAAQLVDASRENAAEYDDCESAHLVAGERFDADLGLIYLRARWMDPKSGRFASADPAAGVLQQPVTLHDYAYAGLNPIGQFDPTGRFSMGEAMSTFNMAANLLDNAITAYDFIFGGGDDDSSDDGIPGIWDYIMAGSLKGLFASIAPEGIAASALAGWAGGTESHHVIPVYVCGAESGLTSAIPRAVHADIHNQLERFTTAVNIAGIAYDLVFKKPKNRSIRTPMQRLGRKTVGREAIAAGLFTFYAQGNYLDQGRPPIFAALAAETMLFIKKKSAGGRNSAPLCQRP